MTAWREDLAHARRAARAFPAALKTGLAEMVAYRAEMVIWFLTATLPLVMMLVWDRVAEGGRIAGLGQDDFVRYFVAALVVRQLSGAWVVWELNYEIRTASLSPALLKPVDPLVVHAAFNIAVMPYRLVVLAPIVLLVGFWRPGALFVPGPVELGLLVLSLALAWLLNFLVQAIIGSLAFFLDQSLGLWDVFFGLFALFSGYLFPLEVLPAWALGLARLLPFQAMLALPVEIAAGMRTGTDALAGVAIQAAWALGIGWLARRTWRRGLRRYEAFGA